MRKRRNRRRIAGREELKLRRRAEDEKEANEERKNAPFTARKRLIRKEELMLVMPEFECGLRDRSSSRR